MYVTAYDFLNLKLNAFLLHLFACDLYWYIECARPSEFSSAACVQGVALLMLISGDWQDAVAPTLTMTEWFFLQTLWFLYFCCVTLLPFKCCHRSLCGFISLLPLFCQQWQYALKTYIYFVHTLKGLSLFTKETVLVYICNFSIYIA